MKTLKFKNGNEIPQLGLGTWQLQNEEGYNSVKSALEIGYRHIDTADIYKNHKVVGQAIKDSGTLRDELFITTKLWRDKLDPEKVRNELERFLEELQLEYIDLILIHWPDSDIDMIGVLQEFAAAKDENLVNNFGVSNFTVKHLKELEYADLEVVNNQVEFHPSLNQKELKDYCDKQNILVTAYSPVGQGEDFELPIIKELSDEYNVSPAQICLACAMAKNMIVIPRSSSYEHLLDNFKSQKLILEDEDVIRIDAEVPDQENRIIAPGFNEFDYSG